MSIPFNSPPLIEDEKSVIVAHRDDEKKPWQTGQANVDRKDANKRAKKNFKKSASSKNHVPNSKAEEAGEADAKKEIEEAEKRANTVVHPWHLQFVKHRWVDANHVIVEEKQDGTGVYKVANFADNLVGTGLFRQENGAGQEPLARVWGNLSYVERACDSLVGETLGKTDFDLKFLVPRALVNLKSWISPWPGVEQEILEYLTSMKFTRLVVAHYERRLNVVPEVLRAKCLRYGAKLGASRAEVDQAVLMYTNYQKVMIQFVSWWFVFIGSMWGIVYWGLKGKQKEAVGFLLPLWICYRLFGWISFNSRVRAIVFELTTGKFAVTYGSIIEIFPSCSKGIPLPELLTHWKFKLSAGLFDLACKIKPAYNSFGTWINGANMAIPNACHHDQYVGLVIRYFFDRSYDPTEVEKFVVAAKWFCTNVMVAKEWVEYSVEHWLQHLPGKRRDMLLETPCAISIIDYISVNVFVKLEAYLGKNWNAFKPRIIQGRDLAYQYLVGPFFYSVSKFLGKTFHLCNFLIYDAGLTAEQLGTIALKMFATKHRVFEIDVSNWDGSLSPPMLEFEIWFIENCLPRLPVRWHELRRHWTTVKGSGKKGVSYSTKHGRRSGDMWTSCFNSLINLLILYYIFGFDLLAVAKGDDNFFGTNSLLSVEEIIAIYAKLGMKAKVKEIFHISDLGYCSGTFYPVDGGWKWGLKPFRIIAKLGLNLGRHHHKYHARLLFGTAISMLPIGGHVPVLGALLRAIVRAGRNSNLQAIMPENEFWKTSSLKVDDVCPHGYDVFSAKYGFDWEDIDDLEFMCTYQVKEMRPLTISDFPLVFDDGRFLRGFKIDADVDVVPDTRNVSITRTLSTWNWAFIFNVLVLSPLLEEAFRSVHTGVCSLVLGILEATLKGNVFPLFFHIGCGLISEVFGKPAAFLFHFLWNLMVLLSSGDYRKSEGHEDGYGSLISCGASKFLGTLSWRKAGLFNPMLDCEAFTNNRLTNELRKYLPLWCVGGDIQNSITKKTNQSKKSSQKRTTNHNKPKQRPKGSLGRSLLKGGLGALGALLGPGAAALGSQAGDWGATILGMGDYEVKHNTISEGTGVPMMHKSSSKGVRISHREYLGDITGSTAFTSRFYSIQPGSTNTFPWLSNIAAMFQSYKIHGLCFDFNSTSADALNSVNTALGTVVMSTQYNVAFPPFLNKAEMEQYEYTVSSRPSRSLMHCVECDPSLQVMPHLFTRTGSLPVGQDLQFYDWGNFQLATVGMQAAATIGELWVTYDIEFFKPRIASGGAWGGDFTRISNGPYVAASDILGAIQTNPKGTLGVTVVETGGNWARLHIPSAVTAGRFLIRVLWKGDVGATVSYPVATLTNLTLVTNFFAISSSSNSLAPNAAIAGVTQQQYCVVATINGYNEGGSFIDFGTAATLPATPAYVDILVVALPLSDDAF